MSNHPVPSFYGPTAILSDINGVVGSPKYALMKVGESLSGCIKRHAFAWQERTGTLPYEGPRVFVGVVRHFDAPLR